MKKTNLGISVGMLGATIYLFALFNSYTVVILLVGYILLFEENPWLRKNAVKAAALMTSISLLIISINLIPNAMTLIGSITAIFGKSFTVAIVTKVISAVVVIIEFIEKILFISLGIKAINQSTIAIPFIDSLIAKHMD